MVASIWVEYMPGGEGLLLLIRVFNSFRNLDPNSLRIAPESWQPPIKSCYRLSPLYNLLALFATVLLFLFHKKKNNCFPTQEPWVM